MKCFISRYIIDKRLIEPKLYICKFYKKKIYEWDRLFLKLRKEFYDATVIGGLSEILANEGVEVENLNYFYKRFLQISQLKVVEIQDIKKHPNSDRLNLVNRIFNYKLFLLK